jgi:anti-anti-sigma factor
MDQDLILHMQQRGKVWIIELTGNVTHAARDILDQAYQGVVQANASTMMIDLTGVDHVVSSGLSLIAGLLIRANRDNRRACLVGMSPQMQKMCQMMGLSRYAEMCNTVEDALRLYS